MPCKRFISNISASPPSLLKAWSHSQARIRRDTVWLVLTAISAFSILVQAQPVLSSDRWSTDSSSVNRPATETALSTPATGAPSITGSHFVGSLLTATTDDIMDEDGIPDPPNFRFQWLRVEVGSETSITGATGATYRLVADDEGKKVKVEVIFDDSTANEETVVSAEYPASNTIGAKPTISISNGSAEEGQNVDFVVSLSQSLIEDVTFTYDTSIETGSDSGEAADFTAQTGQMSAINAGSNSTTLSIATVDDGLDEDDDTFTITLSNPSIQAAFDTQIATGTITDNDDAPADLRVLPHANTTNSESTDAMVQVRVTASEKRISFKANTTDDTANADEDFVALVDASYAIEPGSGALIIPIDVIDDDIFEGQELFSVTISDAINASFGTNTTKHFAILDNETAPLVSISDPAGSVEEGGALIVSVTTHRESKHRCHGQLYVRRWHSHPWDRLYRPQRQRQNRHDSGTGYDRRNNRPNA